MTPSQKIENRTRLIQSAIQLAYRQGFGRTSLADIAKEAGMPVGNLYYYFKAKDEIGEAIIERRLSQVRSQHEKLEKENSPAERLCGLVQMTFDNRETLARGGCPIGTLCSELNKQEGPLASAATAVFAELLAWMEKQFKELGNGGDSHGLAVHLLSALQGVSLLAHNFHNPKMVAIEAQRLHAWIRTLETGNDKRGKS
jgi:AcrR family transcriptional regulator